MSITKPTNTFLGIEVQEPNDVITAGSGSLKDSTYASTGSTVVKYSYRNAAPFPTDTSSTYIEEKLSKRFVGNENFDINRSCVDYQYSISGRYFEKVNNLYFIYNTEGLSVSKDAINWKFVNFNNITPVEKSRTKTNAPDVNKVTYDSVRNLYYATMWNKVFVSEDGFNWGSISASFYNNNLGGVEVMPDGRIVVTVRGSTNFYRFESTDNMVNLVAKSSTGANSTNTFIAGKQGDFLYGVDFSTKGLYKIDLANNTHTLLESFGNTSSVSCAEVGNQLIFIAGTPSTTDIVIVENGVATKVTSAANTGIQIKSLPYMRGNVAKLGNTYYFTPTYYSTTVTGMIKTTDFVTFSSETVTPNKFVTGGDFLCQFVMPANGLAGLFNDEDKLIVFANNSTLPTKPLVGPDFYPMYATTDGKEWFGYGDITGSIKRSTIPVQRNTSGALQVAPTLSPLTVIRNNSAFVMQGANTFQYSTIGMTDIGVYKASLSGLSVSQPPMQYHDFGTGMEAVVGRNGRVYYTLNGFTTVTIVTAFSFTVSRPFLVKDGKLISCSQGTSTNYLVAFDNVGPTYGRWPTASSAFPVLTSGNTAFYYDTLFDSVSNKYVISALVKDPVNSSVYYSPAFLTSTDAENWIAIENASGLPASVSVIRLATMNGNFFLKVYDYNLKEYSTFKSSDLQSWTKIITPFENYQVLNVFTAGSYFFVVTQEGIYYSSSSFDDFKIVKGTAPVFDSETGSFLSSNLNTTYTPQYHVQGTTVYYNTRVGMSYIDATKPEEGLKTISGEGYWSRAFGSNIIRTCKSNQNAVFKLCQGRVIVSRDGCKTWSILFDAANITNFLFNTDSKLLAYTGNTTGSIMYKICPKSGAYTKYTITGSFSYGTPFGSQDTEGFANIGDTIVITTNSTPLNIYTSTDGGVTWITTSPADATSVNPASLFVFEGAFYVGYNIDNTRIARSTDGINWTTVDLGAQNFLIRKLHRSRFNNKMYALALRYSDALPAWVEVGDSLSTQPTYFNTVAFGPPVEYFVAPSTGGSDVYSYNTLLSLNLDFMKYDGTYEYFYNSLGDVIRVDSTYSIDKWRVIYRSEVNTASAEYRAMTLLDDGTLVRSFPQSTPYFWSNAKIVTPKTSQNMRTYDGPTTSYYYIGS